MPDEEKKIKAIGQELKKRMRLKTLMALLGLREMVRDADDNRKNLRRHVDDLYQEDPFTAGEPDDEDGDDVATNINLGDFNFHGLDPEKVATQVVNSVAPPPPPKPTTPPSTLGRNLLVSGAIVGAGLAGWGVSQLTARPSVPIPTITAEPIQPSGKFRVQWEQAEDGTYRYRIVPATE
jgi:hypothetical protein